MDLHVFLYDGIVRDSAQIKFQPTPSMRPRRLSLFDSSQVRDKDPADRDAASDVGCYFTVGDQTFTSDILLNTNEPNYRTYRVRRPHTLTPLSRRHLLRVRLPGEGHALHARVLRPGHDVALEARGPVGWRWARSQSSN